MLKRLSFVAAPASLLLLIATLPAQGSPVDPQPWIDFHIPFLGSGFFSKTVHSMEPVSQVRLDGERPVAVRKMSIDESEMFFPGYWQYRAELDNSREAERLLDVNEEPRHESANASMAQQLQSPLCLHTEQRPSDHPLFGRLPRAFFPLWKRDYQCPSDTNACTSVGRPNSCCPTESTCQLITDTGQGDVGCCAQGQTCSGQVSQCYQGYTSCPSSLGGGCCLPGYACSGVGCMCSI